MNTRTAGRLVEAQAEYDRQRAASAQSNRDWAAENRVECKECGHQLDGVPGCPCCDAVDLGAHLARLVVSLAGASYISDGAKAEHQNRIERLARLILRRAQTQIVDN